MSRKVALVGDTHWGVRNDHPALMENLKRSSQWMFKTLRTQYPDITDLFHVGDFYDRRKYVNFNTSFMAREYMLKEMSFNYRTHIIMGNHDCYYKDDHEVNALRELIAGRYASTSIYSVATELPCMSKRILLLPWICDSNRALAEQKIKDSSADIVFGHLELNGFEMYKNVMMTHGDDAKGFSRFKGVYSGHFHRKSSKGNIHYIGALNEQTWSDYDCPRGFSVLDLDTLELEFIENPNKMFHHIRYDDTNYKPGDHSKIDFSDYENTFVKVIVAKRNDPFVFDLFLDKLHAVNPCDVTIVEDVASFIDNSVDEVIDEAQDTPSILDGYISGLTLPVSTHKAKEYMREVYKEAIMTNEDVK